MRPARLTRPHRSVRLACTRSESRVRRIGSSTAFPTSSARCAHRYAGKRVLVAGSGHSALNALLDLAQLAEQAPGTMRIIWAMRRAAMGQLLGGDAAISCEERGKAWRAHAALVDRQAVELLMGFHIDRVTRSADGLVVSDGAGARRHRWTRSSPRPGSGRIWSVLREVRLELDPAVESPRALAPLIDPNVHSCGSVPPHGAEELKHPEPDFYIVGMKSYGRAPTFLLLTGYEQVRSVVAAIAGDWQAARRVELVLPETGVCSLDRGADAPGSSCCAAVPANPARADGRRHW